MGPENRRESGSIRDVRAVEIGKNAVAAVDEVLRHLGEDDVLFEEARHPIGRVSSGSAVYEVFLVARLRGIS